MLSNSPKTINNDTATSVELIEEYRRQSALASSADRADIDLMDGLKRLIEWRAAHKSEVADRRRAVGLAA